ncbi:hypothetical protein MHYP_G00031810 [Metynnis hypsauchen]
MDSLKLGWILALALSSCVAINLKDCAVASCRNGTARMEIDNNTAKTHSSCVHRLYDEEGNFTGDADASGVTYHSCLPVIQWKIFCADKTNNLVFCFTCDCDTSPDSQSQPSDGALVNVTHRGPDSQSRSSDGASKLWLLCLIPGAAVVGLVVWLVVWLVRRRQKGKNQRAPKEDQGMPFL